MRIDSGYIELNPGGSDCRVPDICYHFEEYRGERWIPNYGIDQDFPQLVRPYDGLDEFWTGISQVGVPDTPSVNIEHLYGKCKPTQIIVSTSKTADRFNYIDFDSFDVAAHLKGFWQFGNNSFLGVDRFYFEVDNYRVYGSAPTFDRDYAIGTYGVWSSVNYSDFRFGPEGRCTWLMTVDPSYGFDGGGPEAGLYRYPVLGTTDMGGWPQYFNGLQPKYVVGAESAYGGFNYTSVTPPYSTLTPPPSCEFVPTQDFTRDYYFDIQISNNDGLGIAIFRDRPMMTYDEFMCWHMEHDWSSDPDFI